MVQVVKMLGEQPRPRALTIGLTDGETAALSAVFPTVRAVQTLAEVAQVDWDVLVTRAAVPSETATRLFVLAAPGPAFGTMEFDSAHGPDGSAVKVAWRRTTNAVRFAIPDELPGPVLRLVERDLAPFALNHASTGGHHWSLGPNRNDLLRPFLLASDGSIIAGSFRRYGNKADCWCLPEYVSNLVPWARAAYEVWSEMDREAFPDRDPWLHQSQWRVPAERSLLTKIADIERERDKTMAALENRLFTVQAQLAEAEASSDTKERALLTGQGEPLKQAVVQALRTFGFEVEDMDERWPVGGRREDLRVRTAEKDWVALAEVRGYKKGAAVNDLLRIGRFVRLFSQDEGRPPNAAWYIVNHFLDEDPARREQVLASNASEVRTFAEDGGLVIDSVEIFKAWVALQAGMATLDDIRASLLGSTGSYSFGPQLVESRN